MKYRLYSNDHDCYIAGLMTNEPSDEKIKVIVCQPDDGGVWVEDPETGEEELYKLDQLYVSKDKLEAIKEIKNSSRYTSYR